MSDMTELEKVIQESATDMKAFVDRSEKKLAEFGDRQFLLEQKMSAPYHADTSGGPDSIADEVAKHSHFKLFQEGGSRSVRLHLERSLFPVETKAMIGSSPTLVRPDRRPGIQTPAQRRLTIRDLLPVTTTTSGSIEWIREDSFTNAAAPTAEGGAKPESALTFSLQTSGVKTIAHWIPAAKQVLDDSAQLRSHIDRRLMFGLQIVEENQLLSGDGTGANLSGLITNSVAYNTAFNVVGDTRLDKLRHAIKQLEIAEHQADGIVLHPNDWEAIELLKDANDRYLFGDPGGASNGNVWSVPRVVTTAIASGSFLVGDFQMAAELFDRQQATIEVSQDHASFFVENKIAVRAEERVLLCVYKPAALISGSFA